MEQNAPSLKCENRMPHPHSAVADRLHFAGKQGKHLVSFKRHSNCSLGAWRRSSLLQRGSELLQMPGSSVDVASERDRHRLSLTCSRCSSSFCRRLQEEGLCILVNFSVLFNCLSFHPSISYLSVALGAGRLTPGSSPRMRRVAHNLL